MHTAQLVEVYVKALHPTPRRSKSSPRLLKRLLIAFLLGLVIGAAAPSAQALPLPLPGPAIESRIGRYMLGESPAVIESVLGRAGTVDEALARLRQPELAAERAELEERIAAIRRNLHDARRTGNGGVEVTEDMPLTAEEQVILRQLASHELRVDARWRSADVRAGQIDFVDSPRDGGASRRGRFLEPARSPVDGELRVSERPIEEAAHEIREEGRRGFMEWYEESQACMKARPPKENRRMQWRNFLQQAGITTGVTLVGTASGAIGSYIRAGVAFVDVPALGQSLGMSIFSNLVTNMLMGAKDTFKVRWIKTAGWGVARGKLDAEVYYVSPTTNTHGYPLDYATNEREVFNYKWNTATSWVNPVLFTILGGLECLAEKHQGPAAAAKMANKGFWIRTGVSLTTSMIFYNVFNQSVKSSGAPR